VASVFINSNILIYLLSADSAKADCAESIVEAGGIVSVQVLNEVTNVMRRKLDMSWNETNEVLALVRSLCHVEPLTIETHDRGRRVAERHGIAVYDAMIVASALLAGCETLFSEDMQNGLVVDDQLQIRNPFSAARG
jgi:predicted nucleic acid-binding protein